MKVLAVLVVVVLLAVSAVAQLPDLLEKAKAGDIDSQLKLAYNYQFGIDGPKDIPKAIEWLRKAGGLGSPEALYRLGMLAYNGDVVGEAVKEDYATSWACFEVAAVLGHAEAGRERDRLAQELTPAQMERAHLRAAAFFLDGNMAPKNAANARAELTAGMEAKSSTAALLLGMTYLDPALDTPDPDKAVEYCMAAEKEGVRTASNCLGKAYEIKGDEKAAFKYFERSAREGSPVARLNIAKRYRDGRGTKANEIMAAAWARIAGEYGEAPELYRSITANFTPSQMKDMEKRLAQLGGSASGLRYKTAK